LYLNNDCCHACLIIYMQGDRGDLSVFSELTFTNIFDS
jgi:hypothetical protein